jgi:hypothetical protein
MSKLFTPVLIGAVELSHRVIEHSQRPAGMPVSRSGSDRFGAPTAVALRGDSCYPETGRRSRRAVDSALGQ